MTTHRFDDKHGATIRPVEKIAPGCYRCEVWVGLTDESLTESRFVREGKTKRQAEADALSRARAAIAAGQAAFGQSQKRNR